MIENGTFTTKEMLEKAFSKAFAKAEGLESLLRSRPLNEVSAQEYDARAYLLNNEDIAKIADGFFREYTQRYPEILTPDARRIIDALGSNMYVTKIMVPETGNINHHTVILGTTTFLPITEAIDSARNALRQAEVGYLLLPPSEKTKNDLRYWSARSVTRREYPGIKKETFFKLRKRKNPGEEIPSGYIQRILRDRSFHG